MKQQNNFTKLLIVIALAIIFSTAARAQYVFFNAMDRLENGVVTSERTGLYGFSVVDDIIEISSLHKGSEYPTKVRKRLMPTHLVREFITLDAREVFKFSDNSITIYDRYEKISLLFYVQGERPLLETPPPPVQEDPIMVFVVRDGKVIYSEGGSTTDSEAHIKNAKSEIASSNIDLYNGKTIIVEVGYVDDFTYYTIK